MPSLPSPDALFVSRKRRSYQVSFSREEADSQRSFQLRNDLSRCPFCPEKKPLSSALFSGEGCSLRGPFELRNALPLDKELLTEYREHFATGKLCRFCCSLVARSKVVRLFLRSCPVCPYEKALTLGILEYARTEM